MNDQSPNQYDPVKGDSHLVGDVGDGAAVASGRGAKASATNQTTNIEVNLEVPNNRGTVIGVQIENAGVVNYSRPINITSVIIIVVTLLIAIVAFLLGDQWRWVSHVSVMLFCVAVGVGLWRLGKVQWALRAAMLLALVGGIGGWLSYAVPPDYWRTQGIYAPTATPTELLVILAEFEATGTKKYDATGRVQ